MSQGPSRSENGVENVFDKVPKFENPLLDALAALPGAGLRYIGGMAEKLDNSELERDGVELAAQVPEFIAMINDLVPGLGEAANLSGNDSVPGLR